MSFDLRRFRILLAIDRTAPSPWTAKRRHVKSIREAVARIAESLGIGRDALLFVDDSPFERAEIGSRFPEVRVLDPRDAWFVRP